MKFTDFIKVNKKDKLTNGYLDDYFTICKRENNSKRDFIIVQECLGKHYPQYPSMIFNYFDKLKTEILTKCSEFENSSIFEANGIFYFAETATAIGEYLYNNLEIKHKFCTTRERKEKKENIR